MDEQAQALALDANNGADALSQNERMIPQSEVSKLIQGAKQNAALKARQEYEMEMAQRQQQAAQQQSLQSMNAPQGGSKQDNVDEMYQQFMEKFNQELQQRQVEQEIELMKSNYTNRLEQGRAAYSDFKEVMENFEPADFPQLTYLVSGIDNGGHILYELAKNPSKLVYLNTLSKESPKMARAELAKLSQSITANQAALAEAADSEGVAPPLDQLQPSRVSGSNGKMSIRDLRAQSWLKG